MMHFMQLILIEEQCRLGGEITPQSASNPSSAAAVTAAVTAAQEYGRKPTECLENAMRSAPTKKELQKLQDQMNQELNEVDGVPNSKKEDIQLGSAVHTAQTLFEYSKIKERAERRAKRAKFGLGEDEEIEEIYNRLFLNPNAYFLSEASNREGNLAGRLQQNTIRQSYF